MIYPDHELSRCIREGRLTITPELLPEQIGPASIDLRLSSRFRVFRPGKIIAIDPLEGIPSDYLESRDLEPHEYFVLRPHEFVLAATMEYVKVGPDIVGRLEGKSTLARMGILVHSAGFVDPGYAGTLTLEISNQGSASVLLRPGMYICHLAIHQLSSPAKCPYNVRKRSSYCGDQGPTPPRMENLFPQGSA